MFSANIILKEVPKVVLGNAFGSKVFLKKLVLSVNALRSGVPPPVKKWRSLGYI